MTDTDLIIQRAKKACEDIDFQTESKEAVEIANRLVIELTKDGIPIHQLAAIQLLIKDVWSVVSTLEEQRTCCREHGEAFATLMMLTIAAKAINGNKVVTKTDQN